MVTVSYSEVDCFRRCNKRWEYRYKKGLKRIRKFARMFKGTILHEMLNALIKHRMNKKYIGPDPWDVLENYALEYATYFEEEKEEHGDIVGDCGMIFEGYMRKWRKDPLKYEGSEVSVYFDISDKLRFVGFIDKIARDKQERRWITDHKFVATIPTANDRFSELQLLLYVWAWNKTHPDEPLDGVLWDYARSKAPHVPELLKSGKGLTQRKNLDCDQHTYLRTIKKEGLDPADYVEMLEHLEGKEDTFYERVFLPKPSDHMIKQITDDFLQSAREIQGKRGKGKDSRCTHSMNPFNCNTCEFRPICEGEVRGHDIDFIIKSEYTQREIGDG